MEQSRPWTVVGFYACVQPTEVGFRVLAEASAALLELLSNMIKEHLYYTQRANFEQRPAGPDTQEKHVYHAL